MGVAYMQEYLQNMYMSIDYRKSIIPQKLNSEKLISRFFGFLLIVKEFIRQERQHKNPKSYKFEILPMKKETNPTMVVFLFFFFS